MKQILVFIVAYLVGAIPSGYWFAKYFFGIDVTKNGSGNIGATNVARVLGSKKYFLLIFFVDFFKAFLTLFCASQFLKTASIMLLVGNAHSIFLRFRGGKGVATSLGILFFLFPILFFAFLGSWTLFLYFFRRVDLSCLAGMTLLVPLYYLCGYTHDNLTILFLLFMVIWIFVRHKSNVLSFCKEYL